MSGRTLDRKRPFAEVFPNGGYEQDGTMFDLSGKEMTSAAADALEKERGRQAEAEARTLNLNDPKNKSLRPAELARTAREEGKAA